MNRAFLPIQQFLITWLLILVSVSVTLRVLGYVGELLSIVISAALIAFLLNYAVAGLQTFLPRTVAAGLVYLGAGFVFAIVTLTVVPLVFNQARQLVNNFPAIVDSAQEQLNTFQAWSAQYNLPFDVQLLISLLLDRLQTQAEAIAVKSLGLAIGTFNWLLDAILILVLSFYMLIDGERVWSSLTSILSPQIRSGLTAALQRNLQRFVSGQLLLGLFMAVTLTVAFSSLRVPFFLLFAVFIGLTEIIPFIGATLGIGTVAIVVAFIDWWLALQVLAIAVALQQVKDNLVAPRIMGNLTGLSPVAIFISLLLGAQLGGFLGVILAIPLTGVAKSLAEIVLDPTLPPQTGSFFHNPFADENGVDENNQADSTTSTSRFSEMENLGVSPTVADTKKIL